MTHYFRHFLIPLTCLLALPTLATAQPTPRTVFNDDAQVLKETPAK